MQIPFFPSVLVWWNKISHQVATENSNVHLFVQYSGPSQDALAYVEWLREDKRFSDVLVQITPATSGHAFPRLKLRYKPSLVQASYMYELGAGTFLWKWKISALSIFQFNYHSMCLSSLIDRSASFCCFRWKEASHTFLYWIQKWEPYRWIHLSGGNGCEWQEIRQLQMRLAAQPRLGRFCFWMSEMVVLISPSQNFSYPQWFWYSICLFCCQFHFTIAIICYLIKPWWYAVHVSQWLHLLLVLLRA